jgi:hypothetical protein
MEQLKADPDRKFLILRFAHLMEEVVGPDDMFPPDGGVPEPQPPRPTMPSAAARLGRLIVQETEVSERAAVLV